MNTYYLTRYYYSAKGTAGRLIVDGQVYYTVERPWKGNEPYESCVPEGRYRVQPYSSERFNNVWELQNVAGRTHILIHAGNAPKDVQGCIAVGLGKGNRQPLWVEQSLAALRELRRVLPDEFELVIRPFTTDNQALA